MPRTSKPTVGSRQRSPAPPGTGRRRTAGPAPSPLAELLQAFQGAARRLRVRWYVFGAQAVAAYGVPRTTADVDVTVLLGSTSTAKLARALEDAGFVLKIKDPTFMAETRVMPATHVASGWDLDVVLGGPGVEELFMARTRALPIDGLEVPILALEDLIATKLLAQRPKDLEDVRGLLRTAVELDRARLAEIVALLEDALATSELAPLLASLEADAAGRAAASRPGRSPKAPGAQPPRRPSERRRP